MSESNSGSCAVALPGDYRERAPEDVPRALRPIERLWTKGPTSLTHSELVSLVLGSSASTPALSSRLVRRFGLRGMSAVPAPDWMRTCWMGLTRPLLLPSAPLSQGTVRETLMRVYFDQNTIRPTQALITS